MGSLKEKNVNTCFVVLREYLEGSPKGGEKAMAELALDQLQSVTAGSVPSYGCHLIPLIDSSTGVS